MHGLAHGDAIGVGLGIALQCDLRIVARTAKYGLLQNRRGVVADFGVEWVLPRLIGLERAFEMLVRGVRIDGAVVSDKGLKLGVGTLVVQVGKRKFARVTLAA